VLHPAIATATPHSSAATVRVRTSFMIIAPKAGATRPAAARGREIHPELAGREPPSLSAARLSKVSTPRKAHLTAPPAAVHPVPPCRRAVVAWPSIHRPLTRDSSARTTLLLGAVARPQTRPDTTPDLEEIAMLYWALVFLVVALVAALLGFGGIAAGAATIAKVLFIIFLVLFLISLVLGLSRRGPAARL
jgi:uncharacterized membrane protein YtjA (UPF0391 family)